MIDLFWDLDGTLLKTHGKGFPCILAAAGLVSANSQRPSEYSGLTDLEILFELRGKSWPDVLAVEKYVECLERTLVIGEVSRLESACEVLIGNLGIPSIRQSIVTGNVALGAQQKLQSAGLDLPGNVSRFCASLEDRTRFDICLRAIRELDAKNAVMIGDSLNDVQTAKQLGVQIIGIATGHHTSKQLREEGATVVLEPDFAAAELLGEIMSFQSA